MVFPVRKFFDMKIAGFQDFFKRSEPQENREHGQATSGGWRSFFSHNPARQRSKFEAQVERQQRDEGLPRRVFERPRPATDEPETIGNFWRDKAGFFRAPSETPSAIQAPDPMPKCRPPFPAGLGQRGIQPGDRLYEHVVQTTKGLNEVAVTIGEAAHKASEPSGETATIYTPTPRSEAAPTTVRIFGLRKKAWVPAKASTTAADNAQPIDRRNNRAMEITPRTQPFGRDFRRKPDDICASGDVLEKGRIALPRPGHEQAAYTVRTYYLKKPAMETSAPAKENGSAARANAGQRGIGKKPNFAGSTMERVNLRDGSTRAREGESFSAKEQREYRSLNDEAKLMKYNGMLDEEKAVQTAIRLSLATEAYRIISDEHARVWGSSASGTADGKPIEMSTQPEQPPQPMTAEQEARYAKYRNEVAETQPDNEKALAAWLGKKDIEIVKSSGDRCNCLVNSLLGHVLGDSVTKDEKNTLSQHYRDRYNNMMEGQPGAIGTNMIDSDGEAIKYITAWINSDYGVNIQPAIVEAAKDGLYSRGVDIKLDETQLRKAGLDTTDVIRKPGEEETTPTIVPILFSGSNNGGHYDVLRKKL